MNYDKLAAAINQEKYQLIKSIILANDLLFTNNLNDLFYKIKHLIYYTKCEYEQIMRNVFK